MPTLQIQLLGDLTLTYNNAPLTQVLSARLQSLFAYLVLRRHSPQNRQQIAFQFWPDATESQARANLRFFLHRLRRELPDSERFLQIDAAQVQWCADAPFTLDVALFEQSLAVAGSAPDAAAIPALERAVELYRGDLLPNCYDDWILPERESLRERYIDALDRLSAALEKQGDYARAIGAAQRLLRADPVHEETYRRLMQLYEANGDRVNALRTWHTCVAVLARELAVEPGAQTRAQYAHLLEQSSPRATVKHPAPESVALRVPQGLPHNLHLALTSFIGRAHEIQEVQQLLAAARLVTLTGAGGSGKTRLALEVATQLLVTPGDLSAVQEFPDGIWWIDLAPLQDSSFIAQAVAAALRVREQPRRPLIDTLIEFCLSKHLLLVLDNCEHLLAASANIAQQLLQSCPGVKILATGRESLHLAGETAWLVPPLAVPEPTLTASGEGFTRLARVEAVRLFTERAALAFPAFELTRQNSPAVVEICRRLDGLPLALELAAARIKVLRVEQIAARLHDRFDLLKTRQRGGDARHQSLRTVMDWSYELLAPGERTLFERLAVFVGGFTLEAVEAVCAGGELAREQILELLSLLVDKSLVLVDREGAEARFDLLETIRQYAAEKLGASDRETVIQQHLAYFLAFAQHAEIELMGPHEELWLERVEREHDNLRAALARADSDTALQLASALGLFWQTRGHLEEGRQWLERTLAAGGGSNSLAAAGALLQLCQIVGFQGDLNNARVYAGRSLALWQALGDERGMVPALIELASIDSYKADFESAYRSLETALALARKHGDKRGVAIALFHLGVAAHLEGNPADAQQRYESSLDLFRELGLTRRIAFALNSLGEIARAGGDYESAAAFYKESLTMLHELGDEWGIAVALLNHGFVALHRGELANARQSFTGAIKRMVPLNISRWIPGSLSGIAGVLSAAGRPGDAVQLLAAAVALQSARGILMEPPDWAEVERIRAALRRDLEPDAFDKAWAEGGALTQDEAVTQALALMEQLP